MDTSYLVKRYAVVSVITMIAIGMLGYLIEVFSTTTLARREGSFL